MIVVNVYSLLVFFCEIFTSHTVPANVMQGTCICIAYKWLKMAKKYAKYSHAKYMYTRMNVHEKYTRDAMKLGKSR